jgi:D-alanyl-D-alanine carboxypeptidase
MPPATVVWSARALPTDLAAQAVTIPGVAKAVTVEVGTVWLTRSTAPGGVAVSIPPVPYGIPIEVFGAEPSAYEPFLPASLRSEFTSTLDAGKGILSQTSADLRKIGVGGILRFGATKIKIGMIVPDPVVGASELFVSSTLAGNLGVTQSLYALLKLRHPESDAQLEAELQPFVPAGQVISVDSPGEVTYLRADGDEVPPVFLKQQFGEFDAHPDTATAGAIVIDAAWVAVNIQTRTVPILGKVQCNAVLFNALIHALQEVKDRGLAGSIHSTAGCYAPRMDSPYTSVLSSHAWGAAIDINAPENPTGSAPTMDRRVVHIFEKWGFRWGGTFPVPDGMHFEYARAT